jgi:hypothetical protein
VLAGRAVRRVTKPAFQPDAVQELVEPADVSWLELSGLDQYVIRPVIHGHRCLPLESAPRARRPNDEGPRRPR